MPRSESRPEQCSVIYQVELTLRQGYSWEAMIPTTEKNIFGWLRSMDHRKNMRKSMTTSEAEVFDKEIHEKARHVLEEVTRGSWHEGEDSPIPNDLCFKRTRKNNLCIGAGNVLAMLGEVAFRDEDNAGIKRRLRSRTWITPGKIVFLRPTSHNTQGDIRNNFTPITRPDGRHESYVPPEPPSLANRFREKPATMKFAERIDPPAHLRFYLCTTKDISEEKFARWFIIAQEYGLSGGRMIGQGKFDVRRFVRLNDEWRAKFFAREREKTEASEVHG